MPEHIDIVDAERHEPKGASTAIDGQVLVANGDGTTSWVNTSTLSVSRGRGFWDYNDLATATTPISVTASTDTLLTNDGLGAFTNKTYAISGIADVYNTSTNQFDWTVLALGDTIEIRLDVEVTTTSANQEVNIFMTVAAGAGGEYTIPFVSNQIVKNAGTVRYTPYQGLYMGDSATLDNPSQFEINTDSSATVKVNGWYVNVTQRAS